LQLQTGLGQLVYTLDIGVVQVSELGAEANNAADTGCIQDRDASVLGKAAEHVSREQRQRDPLHAV
jgi:hypothetical protein